MADQVPSSAPRQWTIHDANIAVYQCLSTSIPTRPALPIEIILQILDQPSRWIRIHSVNLRAVAAQEPLKCSSHGAQHGDWQILVTNPVSARVAIRLRKVVYSIRSQDQGWSSYAEHHGTYDHSWTWFETSLTRFQDQDMSGEELDRSQELKVRKEQNRYALYRNRHAGREAEDYVIELGKDHELLQRVEVGDRFALWARAMYPGWENRVHKAGIEIWGFDNLASQ